MSEEANVYLDDKPCGTIKIVDGHLLLYPLNKKRKHITTRSLNEVMDFFDENQKVEILKRKLVKANPELESWVELHFGKVKIR